MIAITIGARIALSAREVPAKRSRSFGAPADAATIMRDASPDASPKTGNYPYRRLKPRVMTLRQRARKALKRSSPGCRRWTQSITHWVQTWPSQRSSPQQR
ncbi:MAG TPA: hypothetical protein VKF35_05360 [Hyphomicrobiaceae bacterium]|nr:hypothetical protein [Hyphomicrobiaceae bacterium]